MAEDWRITAALESKRDAEQFVAKCAAALPTGSDASRVGAAVFVYPDTEDEARRAFEITLEVAEQLDLTIELTLERWNPSTLEWQAPDDPIPSAPADHPELTADLGGAHWEVRVTTSTRDEADELESALWRRGYGTGRLGRRRIVVATETEVQALTAASFVQRSAALAEIDVRPLGRLRNWWLGTRV